MRNFPKSCQVQDLRFLCAAFTTECHSERNISWKDSTHISTSDFSSCHKMWSICNFSDSPICRCVPEWRPTRPWIKLGVRQKQLLATHNTSIHTSFLVIHKLTSKCSKESQIIISYKFITKDSAADLRSMSKAPLILDQNYAMPKNVLKSAMRDFLSQWSYLLLNMFFKQIRSTFNYK